MGKIFITSDTHIGHPNIVEGISNWVPKDGCRPFKTQKEHDDCIIDGINSVADKDDLILHLGDVAFGDKERTVPAFINRLKCRNILLCLGNHDNRKIMISSGLFQGIYDKYNYKYKGVTLVLFHYPIYSWEGMKYSLHCHGHIHSNPRRIHGRSMDIGVDGNNFKPYLLDDVIDILQVQTPFSEGHH